MFFNFNHVPVVLLSCILAVLLARIEAKLVSPPSSLDLIYPSADTVPFNSSIAVGLSDNKDSVYIGLARNITISITLPNGTETDLLTSFGDCVVPSISGEAFTSVDQEGTYTIHWNITYGLSSDPSQANQTYCGPEPFSYQNWIFNRTLTVEAKTGTTAKSPISIGVVTTASTLPSTPTGKVNGAVGGYREVFGLASMIAFSVGVLSYTA